MSLTSLGLRRKGANVGCADFVTVSRSAALAEGNGSTAQGAGFAKSGAMVCPQDVSGPFQTMAQK